jgi:hypothetical protein
MSPITPSSGRDAAAPPPQAERVDVLPKGADPAQPTASGATAGSETSAVVLDLSERAKMIMARAQADGLVADRPPPSGSSKRAVPISDADFAAKYQDQIAWTASQLDKYLPPESAQALRTALANGTLKFQSATDVAGLNTQTSVAYAAGGGPGLSVAMSSRPTGAVKDAIDQGSAFVFWTSDRGNVYVTW